LYGIDDVENVEAKTIVECRRISLGGKPRSEWEGEGLSPVKRSLNPAPI
jgi:hypothetical protein